MTDPKRWSEGGDASDLERGLLLAGQAVHLPDSERRALWASVALALPVGPPTPVTNPVAAAASSGASLTKGALLLATVAGLTWGAARFWPKTKPETAHAAAPKPAPAPTETAQPRQTPSVVVQPAPTPAASAPVPSDSRSRVSATSQLREESVAVLEARAALRSGDAARSLALLEQARVRFPRGALGQEREALTIQALAQRGDRAAARRRAETFLRAHPQSPYVADVRLVAGQ